MSNKNDNVGDQVEQDLEQSASRATNTINNIRRKRNNKKRAEKGAKSAVKAGKRAATAGKKVISFIKTVVTKLIVAAKAVIAFVIANIVPIAIALGIVIILGFFGVCWNFLFNSNKSNNQVYQNETTANTGDPDDQIYNAWSGVFYEKYADQSLYLQLTTPDEQSLENEVNEFSGKTYEQLGGKSLSGMIQSGTEDYRTLGVRDINNYENQIKVSSGMLAVLDARLNGGFLAPENFVRPVMTTCTDSMGDKIDLSSCELKTGEDGFDTDASLTQKYGIGSIVNYQAYLQPSRVIDYGFKTIEIWDEDWTPGDSGSPVKLLNVQTMDKAEVAEIIEQYKREGTNSYALDHNKDGSYSTGYYQVNNSIVYKDWQEAIKKSTKGSIADTLLSFFGKNEKELGLYNDNNRELWGTGEPGISSGIPDTKVAYAITDALTMYGKLDFTVNQRWIDNGVADHTQTVNYLRPFKDYKLSKDEAAPLSSDSDVTTYKAVYDGDALVGYMNYDGVAHYTKPEDKWVLKDESEQPDTCDINNPNSTCKYKHIKIDGSWDYTLVLDAKGNQLKQPEYHSIPVTVDCPNRFKFAPAYNVMMEAVTEGTLQTYTVIHADASTQSDNDNAVAYLEDYIENYEAIMPNKEITTYECYEVANGAQFDGNLDNAAGLSVGSKIGEVTDPFACEGFAMAKTDTDEKSAMDAFHFENMPLEQYAKIANALGFTDDIYNDPLSLEVTTNDEDIINYIGKVNIALVRDVSDIYGELLDRYGGAYGIDPNLLALIIAQEHGVCSGAYYNGPDDYNYGACNIMQVEASESGEDIQAYNFTLREATSEENSNAGKTFFDLIRQTTSKGNTSDNTTGSMAVGSMETFNVNASQLINGKGEMSGAEVSIKVGAMKLQGLLEYYNYNIPLAIQAYNFGVTAMDAVLDIYEQQTGITRELAIENPNEIGWAHYTSEVHENPKDYIARWTEDTLGDDLYLKHVLGRNSFGSLYAIRTPEGAQGDNVDENTIVSWNTISATDGVKDNILNNEVKNTINSSNVIRAYYRLNGAGKQGLKDIWRMLTLGQKEWDSGVYLKDGTLDLSVRSEGDLITSQRSEADVRMIIITGLSFNSTTPYEDFAIEDEAFWKSRFSSSLGMGGDMLNSSLNPDKLFGEADLVYPIPDFTTEIPYGASYESGNREVNTIATIVANNDVALHSIAKGKVEKIDRSDKGDVISLNLIENGKEQGLLYDTIDLIYHIDTPSEMIVSEGDEVENYDTLANIAKGAKIQVEFLCDDSQQDAIGLVKTFLENELLDLKYVNEDLTAGMEMGGNQVGNDTDFSGTISSGPSAGWIKPVSGARVSAGTWAYPGGGLHLGIDYAVAIGTDIVAPANGVILNIANGCGTGALGNSCGDAFGGTTGSGNAVWMVADVNNHLYGIKILHMLKDSFIVSASDAVSQGQKIGQSGNSGNSSGPHAHVEVTDLGIDGMDAATFARNWSRDLTFGAGWGAGSKCENKTAPCRIRPETVFGNQ